jgi:hypothetical protein
MISPETMEAVIPVRPRVVVRVLLLGLAVQPEAVLVLEPVPVPVQV